MDEGLSFIIKASLLIIKRPLLINKSPLNIIKRPLLINKSPLNGGREVFP